MAATIRGITLGRYSDSVDAKDDEVTLLDNKKIYLGTGSDLELYHDGSNSRINDAGTGNLQLQVGGTTKLEVTGTGISVTGDISATGSISGTLSPTSVDLADNEKVLLGTGDDLELYHDGSNSLINDTGTGNLKLQIGGSDKLEVTSTGVDITGNLTVSGPSKGVCTNNLIINGSMQMYQRSTGSGYTGASSYTLDRWKITSGGLDESCTITRHDLSASDATDDPAWAAGLRSSLHCQNGNQTSGAGAADYIRLIQHIEGRIVRNAGWDHKSTSSYVTLSFWVKSSVAQNFYGYIRTQTGTNQNYIFETGSLTANTWTKVTKTIPGGANNEISENTSTGLSLYINPFHGTDYTGTTTLNQWAAFSGSVRAPDNTSTWYTTNDATFELTGVQLEVGQVANDFKPEPFDELKLRCERYYEKSYSNANGPGTDTASGMVINRLGGSTAITNRTDMSVRFRVEKRAAPTMTIYAKNGGAGKCSDFETGVTHVAQRTVDAILTVSPTGNLGLDLNSGQDDALAYHYVADAEL